MSDLTTNRLVFADKSVYISGAISTDPNFRSKFATYADILRGNGAKRVLNPAELPGGWTYAEYMEHCLLMVRHAEVIVMLPCWIGSKGATAERAYAESLGLHIIHLSKQSAGPGLQAVS